VLKAGQRPDFQAGWDAVSPRRARSVLSAAGGE